MMMTMSQPCSTRCSMASRKQSLSSPEGHRGRPAIIAGHSCPDIAGTTGVLQYLAGQTRPDIASTHFMWWIITLISFGLWYFTLMGDEDAIWIARKTWILVQAGPFGQFIMIWWVVGHIDVKNQQKELVFQGHTHYDVMLYRLEFFCQGAVEARCSKSRRIKRFKCHVHQEQEKRRKQREREARHKTYRQGQPWCPKSKYYYEEDVEDLRAKIDPLRFFHVLSSDFMQPKVKIKALRGKRLKRACIAALSHVQPGAKNINLDRARVYFNKDDVPLIVNMGALVCITPYRSDFMDYHKMDTKIRGLSSNNAVDGRGTIHWTLRDTFGHNTVVEVQAYHVPTAEIRLFSPQAYFKKNKGKIIVDGKHSVLKNINGVDLQILHDKVSNLPMIFGASMDITNFFANIATDIDYLRATLSVTDIQNQNLSSPQKELLRDHFGYGHANMQWIQSLKWTRVYETPEGTEEDSSVLPCKLKRARSCAKHPSVELASSPRHGVEEPECNTVAP
eukprot:scaffold58309_cov49-Attheya_sp.AAC.3